MDVFIIFAAKYLFITSLVAYLVFSFALWRTNIQKFKYFSLLSILSFLLITLVGKTLGFIISSPRPFVTENIQPLIDHAANNGFPSAYTLITIAIASVIFAYNNKLGIVLFAIALLVGTARVLAYIVHPIDIIGSALIGTSVTAVVFLLVSLYSMYNDDSGTPGASDFIN